MESLLKPFHKKLHWRRKYQVLNITSSRKERPWTRLCQRVTFNTRAQEMQKPYWDLEWCHRLVEQLSVNCQEGWQLIPTKQVLITKSMQLWQLHTTGKHTHRRYSGLIWPLIDYIILINKAVIQASQYNNTIQNCNLIVPSLTKESSIAMSSPNIHITQPCRLLTKTFAAYATIC